jgi:hypothetical protein
LKEEYKLQVCDYKLLSKIFGPQKDELGSLRYYTMRNFVAHTILPILLA